MSIHRRERGHIVYGVDPICWCWHYAFLSGSYLVDRVEPNWHGYRIGAL